ncbi:hypothetical protein G6F50_018023 [Rhizopus delemar]|uniref:Uncharacterized protein n=1 Tax=Rhizopus delemar TaxID=936053 RepID=A0A9P6XNL4_9FUNG|nr:hypothetical protein G6F50_018023 [Rhizopus delemar]
MMRLCGSLSPSWRCCADCGWSWPPVLDDLPREPAVRRGMLCCVEGSTVAGGASRHYRYQPSMPWLATPARGPFSRVLPRGRPR